MAEKAITLHDEAFQAAIVVGSNMAGEDLVRDIVTEYLTVAVASMSADTAPAAMPGDLVDRCRELLAWGKTGLLQGEAIRAYAEEHFSHFEREADRIAQAERATNRQAMEAVLGFAPILAEKERVERNRDMWKGQCERQAEALRQNAIAFQGKCLDLDRAEDALAAAHDAYQQAAVDTVALLHDAEARALAAEAALAAERERCLAIVDAQVPDWVKERSGPYWDGYREAMEDAAEDMRKGVPARAAAIRAQGE